MQRMEPPKTDAEFNKLIYELGFIRDYECTFDSSPAFVSWAIDTLHTWKERIKELEEQAQIARVMSLDEVFKWINTPVSEQKPIYWEKRTGRCENGWKCDYHSVNLYLLVRNGYGRCWTQRPTDEQRRMTPWK